MFDTFKRVTDLPFERRKLQCHECHQASIHTLEAKCMGTAEDSAGDYSIEWGTNFLIYRCGNCDAISFMTSSWNSEDIDHDEHGHTYSVLHEKQYPPPTSAEFTFNLTDVPQTLASLLDEMLYAVAGAKLRLATIALRMTIEFIVKDARCAGKDLEKKIDNLRYRNLVDDDQRDLLHKIRKKGNISVHQAKPMSRHEIIAAMGVIELLLDSFYNGPGRQQRLTGLAKSAFAEPSNDPIPF